MKILTVVRQVPDAEEPIRLRGGAVDLESSKLVMDTMDEYGVEQALRLRDQGVAEEVIALGIGPDRVQDALRAALAMGADWAIHVAGSEALDPVALSKVVAEVAKEEQVELLLTGGQQADWDSQALGAAVAERLGWPLVSWTNALEVKDGEAQGKHDVDAGNEAFRVPLPLVVTTQQGLNEPRYPTLPNIMKAKKKEIRRDSLERFQAVSSVRLLSSEVQAPGRMQKIIDGKDAHAAAVALADFLERQAGVAG